MEGPSDQPGLTSRAVRALYAGLKDTQTVHVQYLQLYDEAFLDLLDPPGAGGGSKKLSVAEGANFTYLKGATFVSAPSAEAAVELITRGAAFRAHGKTNMNDASSRSHAILLLAIGEKEAPAESGVVLYMVDLAGSERQKRSGVTGQVRGRGAARRCAHRPRRCPLAPHLSGVERDDCQQRGALDAGACGVEPCRKGWAARVAHRLQGQPSDRPAQVRPATAAHSHPPL
jgi:hypothetical protein